MEEVVGDPGEEKVDFVRREWVLGLSSNRGLLSTVVTLCTLG